MNGDNYSTWAYISGFITFVIVWIYAMAQWGLLLGLMFGWIPALIAAFTVGILWPLFAVILILLLLFILRNS